MTYEEQQKEERAESMKLAKTIAKVVFGVLGLLTLTVAGCTSFYTVGEGERAVHTRTGALVGITKPGLNFKVPFIDDVRMMDVREQPIQWANTEDGDSRMNSYSRDQQPAEIAINVAWSIPSDDATISDIYQTYGSRERFRTTVIVPKTVEAVKNVFGGYDAVTVIQQRSKFNADVRVALDALLKGYPVMISAVQVQDISFSDAYENAVEARMMAQVEVQKREQQKQTAQIDADMLVIRAEADAKQTRLRGDAEAAAIRARSEAIASSPKLVELTLAEKWDGKLPTTMVPGQAVPFINVK
jgi:regulator of protease activity HflC (stomatin/prohibitin superfamily)